jgi:hypothetical protein
MSGTYRKPLLDNFPPTVVDSGFYCDIRFDADDSQPTYIGLNVLNNADTAVNLDWKVIKFTYSGSNATRIQTAYGAWNDRVSLFP